MAKRTRATDSALGAEPEIHDVGPGTPPASGGQRLSVTLTEDGSIAWDRMRPATREQLKKAIGDVAPAAAAESSGIDNESLAAILYGSASTLMMGLARRSGYTTEQASVLAFTPEETQALAGPTGKVLGKYLPTGKYQDELLLGLMLTTVISGKLALLKKTATVTQLVPRAQPGAPDGALPDPANAVNPA